MSDELENLLKAMPLRRPSAALDARIGLPGAAARRRTLGLAAGLGALAAAAAVVVAALVLANSGPRPAPPVAEVAQTQPVRPEAQPLEQTWSLVHYVGAVPRSDGAPLRAFRQQTLRTVRWVDESGATIEVTEPKEEIILVAAETY